jgi:hypothetical protein
MNNQPTPETDNLARGNHVVPTEWAQQLERERNEARNQLDAIKDAVNALHDFVNEKRYDEQAISDLLNGAMKIAKETK